MTLIQKLFRRISGGILVKLVPCALFSLLFSMTLHTQDAIPTFTRSYSAGAAGNAISYTVVGKDPAQGGTTTIPTVLVPLTLVFDGSPVRTVTVSAGSEAEKVVHSPLFGQYAFPSGTTQYTDALLRTTFNKPGMEGWHTLLSQPKIAPKTIHIPAGFGYVLPVKKSGRELAVVDVEFLQKEIFKQFVAAPGTLYVFLANNTTFYADGDATVCCSTGTHGVDAGSGQSFVLGSYFDAGIVEHSDDVQPLSQQLAEFFYDPLHQPLTHTARGVAAPGNVFPAWLRPGTALTTGGCGGTGIGTQYFLLQPTNINPKNNVPASIANTAVLHGMTYHLQNAATLAWHTGSSADLGSVYSFPDPKALTTAAAPCPARGRNPYSAVDKPATPTVPFDGNGHGHQLIGYWAGYGAAGSTFPLREVSPQWDVIIIAFATPDKNAPEGTMQFHTPAGLDTAAFKADIAYLKSQGKKVMISLGGGGQHFTLADPARVPNYISSVTQIVTEYGFDGIDIDFESPSLSIAPGDTDFKHPKTPSIVNLISAMRQLKEHFGPKFMLSLVPEGTQTPGGFPSYGGQFGSYLPILYGVRDILSFVDTQSYNTPPLLGLDGNIYQPGTVDYHVAMTELLLHGFPVGGDPKQMFPPTPASQVATGFLTGDTNPEIVQAAMRTLLTGKTEPGSHYKVMKPGGYPDFLGAMFWTIDADRRGNYNYSNAVGPLLHGAR